MKSQLVARVLIFFMVFIICNCTIDKTSMSPDWRNPSGSEISDDWRKKDINKYLITMGDFNGDGVTDTAKLLVRADGSAFGLFAFVSQEDHTFKTYLLDENKDMRFMHGMGITKASPGLYKTACGKGYWVCGADEMPEISIQYDAINYFKTESANSFFYWNRQASNFKRIWISD